MANTTPWVNGVAPGISAERLNEPFHVAAATYNAGENRIEVIIGPGRAAFLGALVEKLTNSTYYITSPATQTTYYVYLTSAGTFSHNTSGVEVAAAVRLGRVTTGATLDDLTLADDRGLLPGAAARAAQDDLDTHAAATTAHSATSAATPERIVKRDAAGRAKIVDGAAADDAATKGQVDTHAALTDAHSATPAATADRIVMRDASGRAKVAVPAASDDVARKGEVDDHAALTDAHSATSAATPERIVKRDAAGRAKMIDGAAADDVATKGQVDAHAALTTAHGAVATATASKMVVRDASGRAAFADPSAAGDAATKGYVDTVKYPSINEQTGAAYTLAIGDDGKLVDMNRATAQALTVPANASVAFLVGTQILVRQKGAGQVTVGPAGGVTLQSASSLVKTFAQYSVAGLLKTATDTWSLFGDLGA